MKGLRRYIEIYGIMLRNSLIREMSFKANFILWMLVEVLWFLGQIVFFSIVFGSVNRIGDWSKWEVVLLVGTHQIIAHFPLFGGDRFRDRHSLFHHVESRGGQFLDRTRSGTCLRLFQLP